MTALAWTYTTLTAALQTWLDDNDADWVNVTTLGQVVQLAELRLTNDFDFTLFDVEQNVNLTFPNLTGLVGKPAGQIVTDELYYQIPTGPSTGKQVFIERRDYSWVKDYRDPAITGPPVYYAEADTGNWLIGPYPDQAYTLVAYGPYAPQSLLDVSTSTFLSTTLADVMLEAGIAEVARILKNQPRATLAEQTYQQKLAPIKVRLRAYLRNVIESPRLVSVSHPEGARPTHREE